MPAFVKHTEQQAEALELLEHCHELTAAVVGEFVLGSKARAVSRPKDGRFRIAGHALLVSLEQRGDVFPILRKYCPTTWRLVRKGGE